MKAEKPCECRFIECSAPCACTLLPGQAASEGPHPPKVLFEKCPALIDPSKHMHLAAVALSHSCRQAFPLPAALIQTPLEASVGCAPLYHLPSTISPSVTSPEPPFLPKPQPPHTYPNPQTSTLQPPTPTSCLEATIRSVLLEAAPSHSP